VKLRAVLMVAALALAGGACGDDDDDATDAGTESDATNADADSGDDSGDSGDDGSRDDWCVRMESAEFDSPQLDDLDINDPESVENAFGEMVELMDEAADGAPEAIEDDVQLLVDQAKTFMGCFARYERSQ